MGVGTIFSRGASRGFSQNFFQGGGTKVVKFCFYPSKLKKQPFFAHDFKIQCRGKASLPTPMNVSILPWASVFVVTSRRLPIGSLPSQQAKRELKVNYNNETLPFCSEPKYLGITLDRSLTYRRHLESLRKKLTSRVALLRRIAGATMLRTATSGLVHSTAEYYAPAWCRSAHTCLIGPVIKDVLRTVTGCLRPTPADNLLIIMSIQPAELRRKRLSAQWDARHLKSIS